MGSSSSVADDSVQSGISTNPSKALLSSEYVKYALCISSYIFLLIFAGIASGLTIGMMSIDPLKLQLIANSGSKSEKKYATFLLPLIKKTHFLLVSLLLANAACVESLPIFLDRVLSPTLAVAISVTSVLVVGEVIPQALFKRYNLKLSYYMLPFTYITLILTSPISYPVSKILNLVLKKERPTLFTRSELHTLIKMHGPLASPEDYDSPSTDISLPLSSSPTPPSSLILSTELDNAHFDASLVGLVQKNTKVSVLRRNGCSSLVEKDKTTSVKSELSEAEVRMISNILGLRDQTCNEIMSPLDNLFVLHTTDIIDKEFLSKITNCELSYVPVCINNDRSKMRGVINVHKVLACNALTNGSSLGDLIGRENPPWFQPLIYVSEKMSILTLLGIFRDAPQNRIVAVTNEVAFDSTSTIKCKIRGFGGPNDSHLAFYFEQRRQIQGLLKYGSNQTTQPSDFLSPANVQLIRATGIVTWKSLMDHLIKAPK